MEKKKKKKKKGRATSAHRSEKRASDRRAGSNRQRCYFHFVADPNATRYDPKRHSICPICAVKLWELAQAETVFDIRGQCVRVSATPLAGSRTVTLTTGYEVELAEEGGLEHLFNAVFGEVLQRVKGMPEFRKRGWIVLYEICLVELHFIAGQLFSSGSSMDVQFLMNEFGIHWDQIARKIRGRDGGNEPDDETEPDILDQGR